MDAEEHICRQVPPSPLFRLEAPCRLQTPCRFQKPLTDEESSIRWQGHQGRLERDRPRAKCLEPFQTPKPSTSPIVFCPSDWIFRSRSLRLIFRVQNSLLSFYFSSSFLILNIVLILSGQWPNPGPERLSRKKRPRSPSPLVRIDNCGICSMEFRKGTY